MDMRQLRYFIAIAEAGSFSRASVLLRVAQPALSQHVLTMEAALGVRLLHRTQRGVVPTEEGLRLLARARTIEAQFETLQDHVLGGRGTPSGEVRFGMPGTVSEQLGVPLIEATRRLYPEVRIRIVEAMSGYVLDWLRRGTVDLAMLYNPADEKGLTVHYALTEEIKLFAIPDLRGAPRGEAITLTRALALPLIVPGASHGLRSLIDQAARRIGQQVNPEIEIDSYRQIKQLAMRGLGFGMLPAMAISQDVHNRVFLSWRLSKPDLVRRICLGYDAAKPLSAASRAVGQLSWNILKDLVHTGAWTANWDSSAETIILTAAPPVR